MIGYFEVMDFKTSKRFVIQYVLYLYSILGEVMELWFFHVSWCVQWPHHWIGLEKYPKMTPNALKYVHWIRSYGDVFFHVSWCVQWPHHWICLEKMSKNVKKKFRWIEFWWKIIRWKKIRWKKIRWKKLRWKKIRWKKIRWKKIRWKVI